MRYDSTADDDELPPTRPKRRTARSPVSSQTMSGADVRSQYSTRPVLTRLSAVGTARNSSTLSSAR